MEPNTSNQATIMYQRELELGPVIRRRKRSNIACLPASSGGGRVSSKISPSLLSGCFKDSKLFRGFQSCTWLGQELLHMASGQQVLNVRLRSLLIPLCTKSKFVALSTIIIWIGLLQSQVLTSPVWRAFRCATNSSVLVLV